jgi:hypothetical protein
MAIKVSSSTATAAAFATRPVRLHSLAWSNAATVDRTMIFRDAASATATTSVFTLSALRREHGTWHIAGGGLRFNTGLSVTKTGAPRLTVAFEQP